MRILSGAAVGALSLAVLATPAFAQDVEETGFNGVYVGGSVGYSFRNNDVNESIQFNRGGDTIIDSATSTNVFSPGFCNGAGNASAPAGGCENDKDDIEYHARVGFDRQMGNFVLGALVEGGKSQVSDSVTAFSTTPARYTMTREIDWNAALRLRAGYTPNSKTLFYATGGATYAKIQNSFFENGPASFTESDQKSGSWGWQAGGGVEQKIARNLSLGVEYLYTRYNDDDYRVFVSGAGTPFNFGGATGTEFSRSQDKFAFHAIRATAAFRF